MSTILTIILGIIIIAGCVLIYLLNDYKYKCKAERRRKRK